MLVLGRFLGEEIYIGDAITIRICDLGDKRVKIGITDPKELKISKSQEVVEREK